MVNKVHLQNEADKLAALFSYQNVGLLNDHMLNILQAQDRTLDFHVHEDSDELFYVIDGQMQIEFDDGTVDLSTGDFIIVPKGVRHRPVCTSLVKCLLIEKRGTLNRDNTGGTYHG